MENIHFTKKNYQIIFYETVCKISPTFNVQFQINKANVIYSFSQCNINVSNQNTLINCKSNKSLASQNITIFKITDKSVNIKNIDDH